MKTGKDDWYRQVEWNEEIEAFFEGKLKRARGNYKKMQYLWIQGGMLMHHGASESDRRKGVELLVRCVNEYGRDEDLTEDILECKYELGEYYREQKNWSLAEQYFQEILEHYPDPERNPDGERPDNRAQDADLQLAEVRMQSGQEERLGEIFDRIVADDFWKEGEGMFFEFPQNRFFYPRTMAFLCDRLGYPEEASRYAHLALTVVEEEDPMFPDQPSIGKIKTSEKELDQLKKLQGKE